MKQLYILIAALLILTTSVQAQITIYHENFTGTVNGVTGSNWALSTSSPSNTVQASGGANYATSTTSASGFSTKTLTLNNNISTLGYKDIVVSWADFYSFNNNGNSGTNNGNAVKFYYSINNGTYKEITVAKNPGFNQWAVVNNGAGVLLPLECANVANIKFYWTISNDNKHNDFYAIDDITVTGTPDDNMATAENDLSTFNWANLALGEDPFANGKIYAVNESFLSFSKTSAASVRTTKSVVSNTDFQNPKSTLTLIQTGATDVNGTVVKITFSEPVADLTFSVFDVDQASGQFQDRLVIRGRGFGGEVKLAKTKVKTTYNNSFNSTTSAVRGVSGSDVPSTTAGGNLTVTFSEPVAEVTIEYYNTDATRSNSGQQGIGIHNLYWRRDRSMITLPVELLSFNGAVQNSNIKLSWATASESDNDKFVVERSLDGKAFSAIGEVKGNGNSSTRINYTFTDTAPANGTNYYRLRQVDFDGTEDFSKVVAVHYKEQKLAAGGIASVYPSLVSTQDAQVTVRLAIENAQVRVQDANGRLVGNYAAAGRELVVPVTQLQPGMYFVTVTDGVQRQTQRFVKQ